MSYRRARGLFFLCLGFIFWGCTPSDVILVAEGRIFKRIDRDREIDLRMHIFRLANPDLGEDECCRRRKILLDSAENHFIEETGLLRIAEKRKLIAETTEITNHICSAIRFINRLSDSEQSLLKDVARREVLCAKAKKVLEGEVDVEISSDVIEQARIRLDLLNKMVFATNVLIYAHATNVWKKICSGMDFSEAAHQYTEDGSNTSCEWGRFPLAAFASEPDLSHIVEKLHVGEVSPPVQGDNGLLIVRLKGIDLTSPVMLYDLERIFFKLPEDAPVMSSAELKQLLIGEKRRIGLSERLCAMRQSIHLTRH